MYCNVFFHLTFKNRDNKIKAGREFPPNIENAAGSLCCNTLSPLLKGVVTTLKQSQKGNRGSIIIIQFLEL